MLTYSKLISDKRYCPTIQGTKCLWTLPPDFNEKIGQATLGILQNFFANRSVQECVINLEKVTWADPVPLLCLGLLLAESNLNKDRILLKFGEIEDRKHKRDHQIFLKFFAKQGFLTAFGPYVSFQYKDDKATNVLVEDVASFARQLSHISAPSYFNNADCILAKIIPVHSYKDDLSAFQRKVEELIREMKDRIDQTAIVSDPFARDALYQKVRKILFELLLNVAEHAHPDRDQSFAGIYARVRAAKPSNLSEAKAWCELFDKKTVSLYGHKDNFRPNHYAEWLELFICDTGVGLTDNIENWVVPEDDEEAAKHLKIAQQKKNRFQSISNRIFRSSFSRKPRNDKKRTVVTGLRHLGHLLALDHDHCRIYSYERDYPGCWVGDHHPWKDDNSYSRMDISPLIKKQPQKYGHLIPVTGTVYAFSIQPNKERGLPCNKCIGLGQEERQEIIEILKQRSYFKCQNIKIAWFDHRTKDSCQVPDKKELPDSQYDVIVLRPPIMMNKADVASWLALVAGLRHKSPEISCMKMFLVDLSSYQTLVFYELLRHEKVHPDTEMDWYLVSDHWDVCCLSTNKGDYDLNPDLEKAKKFTKSKEKNDDFSIADLAVLLRQMDSEIFWNFDPPPGMNPFFKRPVIWKENKEKSCEPTKQPLILPRYLDFPVALINPPQYHACLRALKRCLALFPGYQPKAADDLVLSLVREAMISQQIEQGRPEIMVGSIVVTGKTLERLVQKEGQKALHIFCHAEVDHALPVQPLVALLWKSSLPGNSAKQPVNNYKAWRRITTTSYIAEHGEKSISILRYQKNEDGSLDFNKPYYARTPEDTYNDFKRLGILKIGHWHYGSRHDLLTINMRLAFRFSFQELGPLYIWLQEQFKIFFTGSPKARAQLLVYPSHPVIDTLFNLIRQDSGFEDKLPEGGMIPIKYVGRRTVSPLLASHLVKERIKFILKQRGWKKWSVVLFDDGTISGKHLRETEQLLQALEAETVYLLVVLDRSGLPVQEEVFDNFFRKQKRFWRWDVPGLGSEGKCPLCKALAVAEIHLHRLSSMSIRKRLQDWLKIWEVRDVDLKWYDTKIKTTVNIDPPLQITFGVDPKRVKNRKPVEKRLTFTDATAATSLVMELTRLTPRMDVAVKKALKLHQDFPDAALELLTSQLFLFIDEMTESEVIERYKKLLEWLWERREETTFTAFAGLSFTLLKNMFIKDLWKFAYKLLKEKEMANLDIIFVVSYLCKRYELLTGDKYIPSPDAGNTEIQNFLALDRPVDVKKYIAALLSLFISNPYHPNRIDTHSTDFKKKLVDIVNGIVNSSSVAVKKIIYNLKQLHKLIIFLSQELFVLEFDSNQENKLINYIQSLASTTDSIDEDAENLHSYLYDEEVGLINIINKSLFAYIRDEEDEENKNDKKSNNSSFQNSIDFSQTIPSICHEIISGWEQIVKEKIEYYKKEAKHHNAIKLWGKQTEDDGEDYILWNKEIPSFSQSMTKINGDQWFYYDKFYKRVIKDIFTNVLYSSNMIKSPFRNSDTSTSEAHMWWRVIVDENFIVFETANATENREIKFRQHSAIACIERTGGKLEAEIKESTSNIAIAYTRLYLPKISYFLGEKNET